MLNLHGHILLHDDWMPSVQRVKKWVNKNKSNYKEVVSPFRGVILFKKIQVNEKRDWDHYVEF